MSVVINGIKMPRGENEGVLIALYDGQAYHIGTKEKHEAIEIPPHGRLIDADKQDAQIEALIERHLHGYTKSTWDFVCELRDILKRNPTIIPAEGKCDIAFQIGAGCSDCDDYWECNQRLEKFFRAEQAEEGE